MLTGFSTILLVCSLVTTPYIGDCNERTAVARLFPDALTSELLCGVGINPNISVSRDWIARQLGRPLRPYERLKHGRCNIVTRYGI